MNWGAMSRAERDAAYNNPVAVTAERRIARGMAHRVGGVARAHPGHLDLRYGPRERNTWDLFPATDPKAPCLVFIHGGYWQRNSKDSSPMCIAGPLCARLGSGIARLHAGARRDR